MRDGNGSAAAGNNVLATLRLFRAWLNTDMCVGLSGVAPEAFATILPAFPRIWIRNRKNPDHMQNFTRNSADKFK